MKNNFNKKLRQLAAENKQALSTRTAKVGGYSVVLALVVLAILVAVNVLFSVLSHWQKHLMLQVPVI